MGPDWRVQFEKGFYSVPYQYIGARVLVYGNSTGYASTPGPSRSRCTAGSSGPGAAASRKSTLRPHQLEWLSADRNGLLRWA